MKFKQHGKRFDWRALLAVWLTLAFLTAAGFAAYSAWQTSRIGFAVHFVDVGQGDGAIVVCDGKIVGRGRNRRETKKNALHHAEIEAIEKACKKLGGWRLHRCDLYVTLEPCPMCAGAIINARIKTVYFGAFDPKAGSCGSMINLFSLPYNHQPELVSGVMEEQCADELRTFFRELRKKRKLIRKAQKSEEAAAESGEAQQDAFCEREK